MRRNRHKRTVKARQHKTDVKTRKRRTISHKNKSDIKDGSKKCQTIIQAIKQGIGTGIGTGIGEGFSKLLTKILFVLVMAVVIKVSNIMPGAAKIIQNGISYVFAPGESENAEAKPDLEEINEANVEGKVLAAETDIGDQVSEEPGTATEAVSLSQKGMETDFNGAGTTGLSAGMESFREREAKAEGEIGENSVESVDSTESPAPPVRNFDEIIESENWITLVRISLTNIGDEDGFKKLMREVREYRDELIIDPKPVCNEETRSRIREKTDEIGKLSGQKEWQQYTRISDLRQDIFQLSKEGTLAYMMGMSGLDCLAVMGRVNGKEGKPLDETIYTARNLQKYGTRAVDGFISAWKWAEYEEGILVEADPRFYLGETFHHLGCADEITTKKIAACHLLLAAVFYQMVVSCDTSIYAEGRASDKQYTVCLNLAIVFDKLTYTAKTTDTFYLESAKQYYEYARCCPTWDSKKLDRIDGYLREVNQRLANQS